MTTYEKNFVEDYNHLVKAYKELADIVANWDDTPIRPNCPKDLLETQLDATYNLIKILETRANTEGIKLC